MPNILIADDHDLVRDTIAAYLENVEDFTVFTASDLSSALERMAGQESIDLLVLDYNMPGMNGLLGLDQARKKFPHAKIALMSGVANREVASISMDRGANGFFPKSLTANAMVSAVRFVLSGERFFPFEFAETHSKTSPAEDFKDLSRRELQTLEQLSLGLANKEIARNMGIQEVTVKLHVKNLLTKLGVANRTQAALLAKERHLL